MIVISTQNFPPDRGGIEVLMGGLADSLHAAGHEIMVFADRIRDANAVAADKPYPIERFGGPRPLRRRLKVRAIAQFAARRKIDGIFTDSWKSAELLDLPGVPMAVLVHGTEIPLVPSWRKRPRIAGTLRRAHAIIPNSEYSAGLVKAFVDEARRIRVVHPPIGPQIEPSPEAKAQARALAGTDGPVLLTVARLEERKGIDTVIRAMPKVLERHPNAVYLVVGGGDDADRLRRLAVQEGVEKRVRFLGSMDGEPKAALFATADVFAMPARRVGNSVESFGIVYVEAGWYGLPSIAGRDGGAGDAVLDGRTGLLCDPFTQTDVTQQILRLLDDAALRKRLGAAAAERARGELQWKAGLQRYLDALGVSGAAGKRA